ncbi:MAG: hypothetical protein IKR38_03360 [Bacteroidales bacterium]|nr:hypothetical protein [Bacteroidales bacterium]
MLKEFFQRRSLRKCASRVPTGLLSLGKVRSAVVFIDVEDTTFDQCKNAVLSFFRDRGIKADIFFFDFRKLSKEERLITSITTTVLRKDLNWYGRPSREKVALMLSGEPDLFISLLAQPSFALEYMAASSHARFKVGRNGSPVFDLVFRAESLSENDAFLEIVKLLDKVS